jgi:chaperonin cofactor prefoldin
MSESSSTAQLEARIAQLEARVRTLETGPRPSAPLPAETLSAERLDELHAQLRGLPKIEESSNG